MARNYTLIIRNNIDTSTLVTIADADLISGTVVDELNGEQSLTFIINKATASPSNFYLGRVVRLYENYTLGYVTYRIRKRRDYRIGLKVFSECYCEHLKYDLGDRFVTESKTWIQESITTIVTYVLGFSDSFTVGTLTDSAKKIDFTVRYENTLAVLMRLAELLDRELYVHASGGTNHKKVSLVTINNTFNGTPGTASIVFGTNLLSSAYERDITGDFASRMIAIGGAAYPELRPRTDVNAYENFASDILETYGAEFIITAYDVVNRWITVNSFNLLVQNDSLDGYYVSIHNCLFGAVPYNDAVMIADSEKTSGGDRIQLMSAPTVGSITVGDELMIYFEANDYPMEFVPDYMQEFAFWQIEKLYQNEEIVDILNILGPAGKSDLSGTYTSGLCEGWNKIGTPTVAENTDLIYVKNGTKSQHVTATDGQGIYREFDQNYVINSSSHPRVNFRFSFYVWIYVVSVASKISVRAKKTDSTYHPPNNNNAVISTGWIQIWAEGGEDTNATTATRRLEIYADGGNAEFYIDSVCLVQSEILPDKDNFYPWCSRVKLWEEAVIEMRKYNKHIEYYAAEFIDLYEKDQSAYAAQRFLAGDTITLTDAGIGVNTALRVMKKSVDIVTAWKASVEIES